MILEGREPLLAGASFAVPPPPPPPCVVVTVLVDSRVALVWRVLLLSLRVLRLSLSTCEAIELLRDVPIDRTVDEEDEMSSSPVVRK